MNIWAWLVIGYLAVDVLLIVGSVGKPRKATTPGVAVAGVVVLSLLIAGVILAAIS